MSTRHLVIETRLGPVTLVAKGETITGLYFGRHARRPPQETLGPEVTGSADSLLDEAARQLGDYLAGRRRWFELPLAAEGDSFQRAVWDIVKSVQCGDTTPYGDIAERAGDRRLAQPVGQAAGANPLCVLVPCHRAVGADGSRTGYAGGLMHQRALPEREKPSAVSAGRLL
ncbi:methylated-DNA--[protein]-cysteine S-methyltransferase [Streptomyces sp. NPDC056161]|uniref:methylated-DNA--[protein]-cysteine S-methyltransferase n=1 Tax=Streptomyces sp. NPDC056161 TaxID=3345732 RepID=UPI0035D68D46